MPPSRHSSSSHRSSSSSHHSSSSHRSSGGGSSFRSSSSRSSSSFRSSGPSSHSSSSHSSGGYGLFGSGNRYQSATRESSYPTSPVQMGAPFTRPRANQPSGYRIGGHGPAPREYHCRKHDYIFYPVGWVNESTGTFYEKGFYDENGNRCDNLAVRDEKSNEMRFVCQYCGTEVKTKWTEGAKPSCPNCSAPLAEIEMDEVVQEPVRQASAYSSYTPYQPKKKSKVWMYIVGALIALAIITPKNRTPEQTWTDVPATIESQTNRDDSIYVEELGRYCHWWPEYDSYYDPETDCYFWYNDEIDYPAWHYWYEGISSNYGDYGWMEYDEAEQRWYIEKDYCDWIVLPEKYNSDRLWHIREN